MMRILSLILMVWALGACAGHNHSEKTIHSKWKSGFKVLTESYADTQIDMGYPLTLVNGEEKEILKCVELEKYKFSEFVEREFWRVVGLRIDCIVIKKYLRAPVKSKRYLPNKLDKVFYTSLPAFVAPVFSRTEREDKRGKLITSMGLKKVLFNEDGSVTLKLRHTLNVTLEEVARGDFNGNGIEDIMFYSRWVIEEAYNGSGIDLIIVEQPASDSAPKIVWQLTDSPLWE